jgi:hypothetical protein
MVRKKKYQKKFALQTPPLPKESGSAISILSRNISKLKEKRNPKREEKKAVLSCLVLSPTKIITCFEKAKDFSFKTHLFQR